MSIDVKWLVIPNGAARGTIRWLGKRRRYRQRELHTLELILKARNIGECGITIAQT